MPPRHNNRNPTAANAATGANTTTQCPRRGTPHPRNLRNGGRQTSPIDVDAINNVGNYLEENILAPLIDWAGNVRNEDWSLPASTPTPTVRTREQTPSVVVLPPTPRDPTPAPVQEIPAAALPGVTNHPSEEIIKNLPVEVKDDLLPRMMAQRAADMSHIFLLELELGILRRKMSEIKDATACFICLGPAYRPIIMECGHSCNRCLAT